MTNQDHIEMIFQSSIAFSEQSTYLTTPIFCQELKNFQL